jgi:hypothetical protein
MSRCRKKKNDSPKDLHSGDHLKSIKLTIEIKPKVETLNLKTRPYLDGHKVMRFHATINGDRHPFALGDFPLQQEGDESLDPEKAIDMMTRARSHVANHLVGAIRAAAQRLLGEAALQQWYSPDEIKEVLGRARAADEPYMMEVSKRFDEITKELSPLGLSKEEMEREHRKRMSEFMRPRWLREWVYVYTTQVANRLQGGARWITKDWWAVEAKIIEFPFYLVSERWNEAKNIRDNASNQQTRAQIKDMIVVKCGSLPEDLLDALFEMKPGTYEYRYQALKIACVDAARQLNYPGATMKQSETIYKILRKYPLYKRPVSPTEGPL